MGKAIRRDAWLPIQAQDFIVTVGGRQHPWLSRILRRILAPFFRWKQTRQRRRDGYNGGAA